MILHGDILKQMATLETESIDCVITSPPYWQLRDYGFKEQWGLEPTYQEYLEHLWQFMDEAKRVLKKTGTMWVNLGDTYSTHASSSSKGQLGKDMTKDSRSARNRKREKQTTPEKCLILIPHRFAIGCIDRGWIMRNDIIWAKRNGMPESVTDRFAKKHEYFFLMAKNPKYYFDLDSIRDKNITIGKKPGAKDLHKMEIGLMSKRDYIPCNPLGRNPGSVSDFWDVTTKGSSDKHYASFNFKLIEKCIVAGCPEGGTILDPFCGTGTTLVRALQLARNVIGIDGSEEYCNIAQKNIDVELNQTKMF